MTVKLDRGRSFRWPLLTIALGLVAFNVMFFLRDAHPEGSRWIPLLSSGMWMAASLTLIGFGVLISRWSKMPRPAPRNDND